MRRAAFILLFGLPVAFGVCEALHAKQVYWAERDNAKDPLRFRQFLDPQPGERDGNRLALANIRERLALMYGERALLKAGHFDAEYIVTLRFPLIERAAELRTAQRA